MHENSCFISLLYCLLEKNELYLQLESHRTNMGEAEERLTRLGIVFLYFCSLEYIIDMF
jgi:hypothetical protein